MTGAGCGTVVGVGGAACPTIGDHLADETVTVAARNTAEISRRLRSWRRSDGLGLWHPTHRRAPAFEYPQRQCHAVTAEPMPSTSTPMRSGAHRSNDVVRSPTGLVIVDIRPQTVPLAASTVLMWHTCEPDNGTDQNSGR